MTQWIFKFNPTEFSVYVTEGTAGSPEASVPKPVPVLSEHRILPGFLVSQSAFCLVISFTLYIWECFFCK